MGFHIGWRRFATSSGAMGQLLMYFLFKDQQASDAALKNASTMTRPGLTALMMPLQLSTTLTYSKNDGRRLCRQWLISKSHARQDETKVTDHTFSIPTQHQNHEFVEPFVVTLSQRCMRERSTAQPLRLDRLLKIHPIDLMEREGRTGMFRFRNPRGARQRVRTLSQNRKRGHVYVDVWVSEEFES